jgi:hypothetical protein
MRWLPVAEISTIAARIAKSWMIAHCEPQLAEVDSDTAIEQGQLCRISALYRCGEPPLGQRDIDGTGPILIRTRFSRQILRSAPRLTSPRLVVESEDGRYDRTEANTFITCALLATARVAELWQFIAAADAKGDHSRQLNFRI